MGTVNCDSELGVHNILFSKVEISNVYISTSTKLAKMAQNPLEEDTKLLMEQVHKLEMMERRTKELVEQRRLERQCLEMEGVKMERQKKYLTEMLKENEDVERKYLEEEQSRQPFHGAGNVLGAPSTSASRVVVEPSVSNPLHPLEINPSQPKGNIQVRLADGGKLVLTLNHSHTIRDLKHEIRAKQQNQDQREFMLVTVGAPPKKFIDENQTVKDAGLISAAVLQRFV